MNQPVETGGENPAVSLSDGLCPRCVTGYGPRRRDCWSCTERRTRRAKWFGGVALAATLCLLVPWLNPVVGTSVVGRALGYCNEAYAGRCLSTGDTDYDCKGEGDGPRYTGQTTLVRGKGDPFELDADGDGVGCEPYTPGGIQDTAGPREDTGGFITP